MKLPKPVRNFVPVDFNLFQWADVATFFDNLLARNLDTLEVLEGFMRDRSELDSVLEEDFAWRYINMNRDTQDEKAKVRFEFFMTEIQPYLESISHKLDEYFLSSPLVADLEEKPEYKIMIRGIRKRAALFRPENVALGIEIEQLAQKFGELSSQMMIEHEGEEITLQQAGKLLQEQDRDLRQTVFEKTMNRRLKDQEALDDLLTQLVQKRHQLALNAGFKNYVEYVWQAKGRFDYTVEQVREFHDSVRDEIMPLVQRIQQKRAAEMGLEKLRPYDLSVDPKNQPPLKPFNGGADLLEKSKAVFERLRPEYKTVLEAMDGLGHFDLESRKGKAPGGFMYPMYEVGYPFIYMNAVGSQNDVETMVHEAGHALHYVLAQKLPLVEQRSTPSEVAELASMSMELLSMPFWTEFYPHSDDLHRAFAEKYEDVIMVFPWVMMIDKFQLWLYKNPEHTLVERKNYWDMIMAEFDTGVVDHSGYEALGSYRWQAQLHIFEVPLYYIEYAMAQLGAIGVWQNALENQEKALDQYEDFMRLGYTKTIPEIYETAGVQFDFGKANIKRLVGAVYSEWSRV